MSLILYDHPLASFCHKVLIALYENRTPFEARHIDLSDAASSAELFEHWPVGKIPVLRDTARNAVIPETSIIIEYLEQHYPGPTRLLPEPPELALQIRLWDRFFDSYVQVPMQKIVIDRLRPEGQRDAFGVEEAQASLRTAYAMLEKQLREGGWIASDHFSLADCAAAPALFYAHVAVPFDAQQRKLAAYFERLLERPSFARVLDEARPYFPMYPLNASLPARFWKR